MLRPLPNLLTCERNRSIELLWLNARKHYGRTARTNEAEIILLNYGTDTRAACPVFEFAQGEFFEESIHIPHGVAFNKGAFAGDFHYCLDATPTADQVI